MAKGSRPAEVFSKVVAELQKLPEGDRARIMKAILAFFGQAEAQTAEGEVPTADSQSPTRRMARGAGAFFEQKQPKTKLEELAVAARYREETAAAEASTQEQLKSVFDEARRHFDAGNFRRDIENARIRGLFLRAAARNEFRLSAIGQKIVDALPVRKAVRALGGGRKRTRPKKKG